LFLPEITVTGLELLELFGSVVGSVFDSLWIQFSMHIYAFFCFSFVISCYVTSFY